MREDVRARTIDWMPLNRIVLKIASRCSRMRIVVVSMDFPTKLAGFLFKKLYIRSDSCVTFDDNTNNTIGKKISDGKSNGEDRKVERIKIVRKLYSNGIGILIRD